ncbi:hypothetical protein [Micromonospora rubida]|uniref:hypothetical protein n=1 Tax=Micromonospora rubida TaxID=2697657 RepID=UPI001377E84E|nr:hypothetical protein [Micromonospora rubida]NBE80372.1 hypothetical protein [Micromonospora rubida]
MEPQTIVPGLLAVAPVISAGFSLIAFSGGNRETLLYLTQNLNLTAILVASYAALLPNLILIGFVCHVFFQRKHLRTWDAVHRFRILALWIPVLLVDLLMLPQRISDSFVSWGTALGAVIYLWLPKKFVRILWRIGRSVRSGDRPEDLFWNPQIIGSYMVGLLMVTVVILAPVSGNGFLPSEVIDVSGEDSASTGYVVEDKEDEIAILWHDGRGIRRYPSKDVRYRRPCHFEGEDSSRILTPWTQSTARVKRPATQVCILQ